MFGHDRSRHIAHLQGEAIGRGTQSHGDRHLSFGTFLTQQAFHLLVVITIKTESGTQVGRHLQGEKTVALYPIHTEALELAAVVDEAESVAITERRHTCHIKRIATHLLDRAHKLAHSLGRVERGNIRLSAMQEIRGIATIEGLAQIRPERIGATALRGTLVLAGMLLDIGVEQLAIGRRHILHIRHILESALNLKRHSTRLDEFAQMFALVHILQREEIALRIEHLAISIEQVELHAAELGTGTTVGAAAKAILRRIAESAIADAERTMDKDLEFGIGLLTMDVGYLLSRQLARQYHTGKAQGAEPTDLPGRAVIRLRRGMNGETQFLRHLTHPHILHQNSIHLCLGQLLQQRPRIGQFIIIDNGIDRDIDTGAILMGILAERADIVHTIAHGSTRTKARSPDIHGISPMVDGSNATLQILGRSQQFQLSHSILLISNGVS